VLLGGYSRNFCGRVSFNNNGIPIKGRGRVGMNVFLHYFTEPPPGIV
jgi:hypothetical protein